MDDKHAGIAITRPGTQSLSFFEVNTYINDFVDLSDYEKGIIDNLKKYFYLSINELNKQFENL